jgi:inorganic triphosphatase YgiF
MTVAPSQSARSSSSSNASTLATLYDSALGLPKIVQIRPGMRRKAGRGYGPLGVTDVPQPVQAGPVTLDPTMTVEAALQRFGQRCLNHLLRNEPVALAGEKESTKCAWPPGAFARCFPR